MRRSSYTITNALAIEAQYTGCHARLQAWLLSKNLPLPLCTIYLLSKSVVACLAFGWCIYVGMQLGAREASAKKIISRISYSRTHRVYKVLVSLPRVQSRE